MRRRLVNPSLILGCLVLLSAALSSIAQAEAKPGLARVCQAETQKRSVIDYFYLLPRDYMLGPATRQEKRQLLEPESDPIIDERHDYLLVHPDSAPAEEIAVFRAHGKPDLIADSSPDFESDYNNFTLYRLQNGKLRDVTRQMLPMPADPDHLLYNLPQFGTTIRVFRFSLETQSRPRHAFDLQWRGGRFVKVR